MIDIPRILVLINSFQKRRFDPRVKVGLLKRLRLRSKHYQITRERAEMNNSDQSLFERSHWDSLWLLMGVFGINHKRSVESGLVRSLELNRECLPEPRNATPITTIMRNPNEQRINVVVSTQLSGYCGLTCLLGPRRRTSESCTKTWQQSAEFIEIPRCLLNLRESVRHSGDKFRAIFERHRRRIRVRNSLYT